MKDRRAPAFQHVRHLRHVELPADQLQLGDVVGRLDEDAVGAGRQILLGAAERFVEAEHVARVGARQDEGVAVDLLRAHRADLGGHFGGGDHVLAGDVSAPLRRELILEHDRRHAHPLVAVQHVHDVLHVAVAVVAVHHDRQIARRHDVGDGGGDFAERNEADVGQPPARADGGKSAGEIGLEAGALDQARAERVERARQDQRALALDQRVEAHCSLIFPSPRMPCQRAMSSASSARIPAGPGAVGGSAPVAASLAITSGSREHGAQLGVEPRDHRVGRLGRRGEAEPGDAFEARHAGFRDRRDVGRERRALLGGDGETLELAGADLRQRPDDVVEDVLHAAFHHVGRGLHAGACRAHARRRCRCAP